MTEKTPFWTRVKHRIFGRTMTYADYEGVTASDVEKNRAVDPMVTAQQSVRSAGIYPGGGI
ncbi:hypothetical protein [Microbacterium sp. RU33B]|uniref:hypothetical protein n=1 Tax=Microbacterium sp. RU33B TaxID=1907390 RepID=UPI000967306C|nr:hypothetical protein [Microbacterium sp. RU33B]SIT67947.1 hypothetical protein SAMN05880545_0275 [Microbacterium sp. RU33B]